MELKRIEHIGIAVKDLESAINFYQTLLGIECYSIEEVKDQKVKTAFLKVGETKIELLESTDPEGPISKFIEKKGEGFHHIAYEVDDLSTTLAQLPESIQRIDNTPRKGAEGLIIAFLHPKSTGGVLTELCENPNKDK